jgi:hypothetical protein
MRFYRKCMCVNKQLARSSRVDAVFSLIVLRWRLRISQFINQLKDIIPSAYSTRTSAHSTLLRKHFGHAKMNFAHFLACRSSALIDVTEIRAFVTAARLTQILTFGQRWFVVSGAQYVSACPLRQFGELVAILTHYLSLEHPPTDRPKHNALSRGFSTAICLLKVSSAREPFSDLDTVVAVPPLLVWVEVAAAAADFGLQFSTGGCLFNFDQLLGVWAAKIRGCQGDLAQLFRARTFVRCI